MHSIDCFMKLMLFMLRFNCLYFGYIINRKWRMNWIASGMDMWIGGEKLLRKRDMAASGLPSLFWVITLISDRCSWKLAREQRRSNFDDKRAAKEASYRASNRYLCVIYKKINNTLHPWIISISQISSELWNTPK